VLEPPPSHAGSTHGAVKYGLNIWICER
jgi:hypothetical protein